MHSLKNMNKLQHQEAFLSFHLNKICSLALLDPFKAWNHYDIISLPFHIPQAWKNIPLSGKVK